MTVRVASASDTGLRRSQNEDRFAIWPPDGAAPGARGLLLVVADGMGGAEAGEIASQLAVETVVRSYGDAAGSLLADLRQALVDANHAVHDYSRRNPELRGMGTTCTALVVRDADLWFAHVGDSRAYLVRAGAIRQLTQDHSLVAQLVEHRHITPEQAKVDPRRNVVTRSVGVGPEVEVDAAALDEPLRVGDTVVICSDGLHGLVEDGEIAALAGGADPDRACRELISLANERGGIDNITVVLGRLEG